MKTRLKRYNPMPEITDCLRNSRVNSFRSKTIRLFILAGKRRDIVQAHDQESQEEAGYQSRRQEQR